jgi:homopolymeric O-antigen transport system permease protein
MAEVDQSAAGSGMPATITDLSKSRLSRMLEILIALARADLRARYGRGRLRLVKWLLDPYALLGVYLLLVTFAVDKPGQAPGLSLACAIIPFQLVMAAVASSTNAVTMRESIILNMKFDRTLIPPATVATETLAFMASLSMIALTMIVYGVAPTPAIAWYPVVLAVNVILALAVAYPVSLIGLWFRELRVFVISFARATFFLSPGLVPLAETSERAQAILRFNPLTGLFEAHRSVFLYGHAPKPVDLLYPFLFALALLVLVVPLYRNEQRQFAKVIE